MPQGQFLARLPGLSAAQIFAVLDDIEAYPDFIPWCRGVRVLSDRDGERWVENRFRAGPVSLSFVTHAIACPPVTLSITSRDGPFERFQLDWRIEDGQACAEYRIRFRSALLDGMAAFAMPEVERRIAAQFRARAEALYGI